MLDYPADSIYPVELDPTPHFLPFFYFLTLETGEFTGHAKATFPYLLAAKDGQMIYLPDCVLKGFCLSDPDHLTGLEITNLCSHWLCDPSVLEGGKVDAPLLLSGLMYREICRAMEMEPDAPTGAPKSLINSPFGIKELKEIEAVLDNVVIDATDT